LGELKTIIAKIESDVLHVPEEVREILGHDTRLIVGTAAVIAFSAGTSYADILRSLDLIRDDIQLRASEEKAEASKSRKSQRGPGTRTYSGIPKP
jgi:hypothetical protein